MRLKHANVFISQVVCTVVALLVTALPAGAQLVAPPGSPPIGPSVDLAGLTAAPPRAQSSGPPGAPTFRWKPHPTLSAGPFELALRARIQLDTLSSDAPFDEEGAGLLGDLPRKRIGVEGRVRNIAEFQLERELGDDEDPWRDVYVNVIPLREVRFQYGKFKVPFGMDENTSSSHLDFAFRSLMASTLAPGRDRGFMIHGELLGRLVGYQYGQFDHDGKNARPNKSDRVYAGKTTAVRLFATPLRPLKADVDDLEVAVAWTTGDVEEGFSAIRGQTVFGARFFSNDYYVVGERKRKGFEARWRPGPFSVQWEYATLTDERRGMSVEDTDLSLLRARGWYLSGSWAVTGDRKADGLETTKHPFLQGGIGAVEVAARIERLTFDSLAPDDGTLPSTSYRADHIIGNSDRALTFGVNWYLNQWIRVQFNMIRETLTDPALGPAPDRADIWSRVFKLQFAL